MFSAHVPGSPGKFVSLWVALITVLLSPLNVNAQGGLIVEPRDDYQTAKEVHALLQSTQQLANTVGQFKHIDSTAMIMLNRQFSALKYMSPEELQAIGMARPMLIELRERIDELNQVLSEQTPVDPWAGMGSVGPSSSFVVGLRTYPCPAPYNHYSPNWLTNWIAEPQGPCGDKDLIDASHPLLCPLATPPTVLIPARQVAALARGLVSALKKVCFQSVFGNNLASGCAWAEAAYTVLVEIFNYFENCNNKRGEAEAFYMYVRSGEIFVKNKSNFALQSSAMKKSFDEVGLAEGRLDTSIGEAGDSMRGAMTDGLTGIEAQLVQLETASIKNSQSLDRVLREQLEIMELLGISYLHQTPNSGSSGTTSFSVIPVKEKSELRPVPKSDLQVIEQRGATR